MRCSGGSNHWDHAYAAWSVGWGSALTLGCPSEVVGSFTGCGSQGGTAALRLKLLLLLEVSLHVLPGLCLRVWRPSCLLDLHICPGHPGASQLAQGGYLLVHEFCSVSIQSRIRKAIKAALASHLHVLSHIPPWAPAAMFTWSLGLRPDHCGCCMALGCMRDQASKRSRSEDGQRWDNPQET